MHLDKSQQTAVDQAAERPRFLAITGPAGTGKTTVIHHIADALGGDCYIMAPTGKAAARVKEATGYDARTCHSYLQWDGAVVRRSKPFHSPIIIDEASMCDSWLLAQIVRFRPPSLILVGDRDQLPPVGRGQPFHDLVGAGRSVVELTVNHRAKSAIHQACSAIRDGEVPRPRIESDGEVWSCAWTGDAVKTTERLLSWIERNAYDPAQDVVLAPQYGSGEGDGGIDALNAAIKSIVNPVTTDGKFQVGDRILICKNSPEADLWNGDTGTVAGIGYNGKPIVQLDRDPIDDRELTGEQVRDARLGYALSVHKSQGSEFRRVFFVCLDRHSHMLDRSLIYTAVTRAREGCAVMGSRQAFAAGVEKRNAKQTVLAWLAKTA